MLIGGALSLASWGLLLGALGLLVWLRPGRRGEPGRRSIPLGGQQALHVVELEGRRLVIGTGPGAAPRLLTELTPHAEPEVEVETWPSM